MKILVAHTRELCYYSGGFFADRLSDALEMAGAEVTRIALGESDDFSRLEQCRAGEYDAIVDFNSRLPYLKDDASGAFWLDGLKAPFFDVILDHPLYHHPALVFPLKRCYAVAIDRAHAAYMRKYYPALSGVFYLPMGGTQAISRIPRKERRSEIFFSGTYLPREKIEKEIASMPQQIQSLIDEMRDFDPMTETLEERLHRQRPQLSDEDFILTMNALFPLDRLARYRMREHVIFTLARLGVSLALSGEGWEETGIADLPNVCLLPPTPMAVSIEQMQQYRTVLDITPGFFCGLHDRASSALANEALLVTCMNPQAEPGLSDGRELLYFDWREPEEMATRLQNLGGEQQNAIAGEGRRFWERSLTWESRARQLIAIIENVREK